MSQEPLLLTSGFWPRVRARALRAPVFLDHLHAKRGATRPPGHRSFAAPVFITFSVYYEELFSFHHLVKRTKKVFLPLDHRGAKGTIVYYIL
jgi:hypothetical protein